MTRDPSVLESNLERLFARAYVPVDPSPELRARILAAARNHRVRARRSSFPAPLRVAAAAAIALGAGIALWRSSSAKPSSVESILAEGRAAVRVGTDAAWRPLTEEEARSGVRLAGGSLDLATPAEVSASVRIGAADRLEANPASQLAVADAASLAVALDRGGLVLEHAQAAREARLSSPDGSIRLSNGAIELARLDLEGSPATRIRLRSGVASVDAVALTIGAPVWLRSGAIVAEPGLDGATAVRGGRAGAEAPAEASSAPAPTAEPDTVTLRGRVSTGTGDAPIESCVVTLLRVERLPQVGRPEPHEVRGPSFDVAGVRPGTYTVFVRAKGFATWQRSGIELEAGKDPVDLAIALDRGATVRGRVLGPDGEPIEGATVLSETDTPSQVLPFTADPRLPVVAVDTTSGADGTFEVGPLSNGRQRLRATRAGFGAAWSQVFDLSTGAREGASGAASEEIVIRLVRAAVIEGQVARDDGAPWPGAIVIASWLDMDPSTLERQILNYGIAIADGNGHYLVEDLPPGLFVVLNVMEGTEGKDRVPRVQQARVEAGQRVRVDLPGGDNAGTAIEGTLLSSDGKPLAGRDVTFLPEKGPGTSWMATRSRDDGRFDFPNLPPGPYFVFAGGNLGGEIAFQTELEVPKAPVYRPEVRAGSGSLRGRVTDAETGRGLPSSTLILLADVGGPTSADRTERFAGRIVADAEGRYALTLLQPGKYRVTAYAIVGRYGEETIDSVEIGGSIGGSSGSSSETPALDFALRPGSAVTVSVRDESGAPVEGASLRFADAAGRTIGFSPEDRTDSKGEFVVHGAKPGRWTLRVERAGSEPAETVLDLAVGEERNVEIRLHPVR